MLLEESGSENTNRLEAARANALRAVIQLLYFENRDVFSSHQIDAVYEGSPELVLGSRLLNEGNIQEALQTLSEKFAQVSGTMDGRTVGNVLETIQNALRNRQTEVQLLQAQATASVDPEAGRDAFATTMANLRKRSKMGALTRILLQSAYPRDFENNGESYTTMDPRRILNDPKLLATFIEQDIGFIRIEIDDDSLIPYEHPVLTGLSLHPPAGMYFDDTIMNSFFNEQSGKPANFIFLEAARAQAIITEMLTDEDTIFYLFAKEIAICQRKITNAELKKIADKRAKVLKPFEQQAEIINKQLLYLFFKLLQDAVVNRNGSPLEFYIASWSKTDLQALSNGENPFKLLRTYTSGVAPGLDQHHLPVINRVSVVKSGEYYDCTITTNRADTLSGQDTPEQASTENAATRQYVLRFDPESNEMIWYVNGSNTPLDDYPEILDPLYKALEYYVDAGLLYRLRRDPLLRSALEHLTISPTLKDLCSRLSYVNNGIQILIEYQDVGSRN